MKHMIRYTITAALLAGLLSVSARADNLAPGFVDFGKFSPPANGAEFVEVRLNSSLISMAARLTEKVEPSVCDLIRAVKGIRVNVIGLNEDNRAEIENRIKTIRSDLEAQKWEPIVTVKQSKEDITIYLKTRGEEAIEGLVVTMMEGNREAILVNIVGDIRPEKIALIAEQLNIEPLKKIGKALEKK